MGDNDNVAPGSRRDPDTGDSREDFENRSQVNAEEGSDSQTAWEVNRKRTYDAYQHPDLEGIRSAQRMFESTASQLQKELSAINNITIQHLSNASVTTHKINTDASNDVVSTRAQVLKHADVAADALWTDELNPTMHGAEAVMAGQAPVNSQLASTASLDTTYTNLTAQIGILTTLVTTQAQALAQSNKDINATNAALVAALAQMVQNAKQGGTTPAA